MRSVATFLVIFLFAAALLPAPERASRVPVEGATARCTDREDP
jgi:hypothetical protein